MVRWMVLLALGLALVGCSTPSGRREPPPANSVHITPEAEAAAEREGVDLARTVGRALSYIQHRLDLVETSVFVEVNAERTISEVGVGGYTNPKSGVVSLALDPAALRFEWTLTTALPVTLAHELHHSVRILNGPGYGSTLKEAIVTEGLADAFAQETYPAAPASTHPWTQASSDESLCRRWRRAQAQFGSPTYDHGAWFFGTNSDIPRWTGYQLGSGVVAAYLSRHPETDAAELVRVDAPTIVERSGFCANWTG